MLDDDLQFELDARVRALTQEQVDSGTSEEIRLRDQDILAYLAEFRRLRADGDA